ncbi:zinc metalloproteinase nas-14-like [Diabrotica undecimpunctata]|uniref:zinc metalloproteinase nas-14-like n=1 Tax=Diabrotica undecimpunctata TaxID=50387 RepID=UPI003B63D5A9
MYHIILVILLYFDNASNAKEYRVDDYKGKVHPAFNEKFERVEKLTKLRSGLGYESSLAWDNGIIPYELHGVFSKRELTMFHQAIEIFKNYTCVKFIPRTNEAVYVKMDNFAPDCLSTMGKNFDNNISHIILGRECFNKISPLLHEMMHTVGFDHEHTRPDRNQYITINWDNIKPSATTLFEITPRPTYGVPYDYDSIMHYAPYSFTKTGFTIVPKDMKDIYRLGQSLGLSKLDITKINILYNCSEKTRQLNLQDGILYGIELFNVADQHEIN